MRKQLELGAALTRKECDAGMLMLALAGLPRAGVADEDTNSIRAIYFELLHKAGVTGKMFKSAVEGYIMQPRKPGKTKYYPDPGQLAEMCRDEIEDRRKALAGLSGALALLESPPQAAAPAEEDALSVERMAEIRRTVEKLHPARAVPDAPRRRERPAPASPSVNEILASRDPAAVERFRNFTKQKQQA